MFSHLRAGVLLALLLLAACQRETSGHQPDAVKAAGPSAAFDGDPLQIAEGQRLFGRMSCAACHTPGGMGPSLVDEEWRYGGSMAEIATTILDGRPKGMPAFRNRIGEEQAWQLAAYLRSLSAQPRREDPSR
jgi:cytochrome c oxidase cbb3-type subunit 3